MMIICNLIIILQFHRVIFLNKIWFFEVSPKKNNFFYIKPIKGSYPARLNKIYVVAAPFWFKCVVKVLGILMREKIKERVNKIF